jgi:hypothetical protein
MATLFTASAAHCRWAAPTIFLDPPFWFEAEASLWSCVRLKPRPLDTTEECETCAAFERRRRPQRAFPKRPEFFR